MRRVLVCSGLIVLLGLSACDKPAPEVAATDAAVAAPKSTARQQQMYAGQEQLASVTAGKISVGASGALQMQASATAPSAGYTHLGFLRRIYPAPPKDGIYELDVVGDKPAGVAAAVMTPVEVTGAWDGYPKEHLKGVKLVTRTGSVVAMLPPA